MSFVSKPVPPDQPSNQSNIPFANTPPGSSDRCVETNLIIAGAGECVMGRPLPFVGTEITPPPAIGARFQLETEDIEDGSASDYGYCIRQQQQQQRNQHQRFNNCDFGSSCGKASSTTPGSCHCPFRSNCAYCWTRNNKCDSNSNSNADHNHNHNSTVLRQQRVPSSSSCSSEASSTGGDHSGRSWSLNHHDTYTGDRWLNEITDTSNSQSDSEDDSSARWSPLHRAASRGHVAAVQAMVSAGANKDAVDDENCTALHLAVFRGHEDVVEALLGAGAKIDTHDNEGETPLHTAAGSGNLNMVRVLLKASSLEVVNGNGGVHLSLSPLHRAALGGHSEVMRELLAHGACLGSLSCGGRSVLHACAMSGSGEAVRVLLERDAELEARDEHGCTATHIAAGHRLGSVATLEAFLKAGADMHATSNAGETPLHRACKALHADSVKLLLRFGADEAATDGEGRTPAAVASQLLQTQSPGVYRNRLDEILSMLAKAPADRVWRRRGWLIMMRVRRKRRESWIAAETTASADDKQPRHAAGGVLVNLPRFVPSSGGRSSRSGRDGGGGGFPYKVKYADSYRMRVPSTAVIKAQRNVWGSVVLEVGSRRTGSSVQQRYDLNGAIGGVLATGEYGESVAGKGESVKGVDLRASIFGNRRTGWGRDVAGDKGNWYLISAVRVTVGVEEEGVFRTILGFL